MKKIVSFCFLLLLAACQPSQVYDSSHITEKEVIEAMRNKDVNLTEAESSQSVFESKLRNVKPGLYEISGNPFFIFEFKTEADCEKGKKEFANKTATMNLVSFSRFEKRNILIFYVHGQDLNAASGVPFEKEIQQALDSMMEG